MIDSKELASTLEPKLAALECDANFFSQSGDFSVYDAYPVIDGQTYRVVFEVDVRDALISTPFLWKRGSFGTDTVDFIVELDDAPNQLKLIASQMADTLVIGVGELLPSQAPGL